MDIGNRFVDTYGPICGSYRSTWTYLRIINKKVFEFDVTRSNNGGLPDESGRIQAINVYDVDSKRLHRFSRKV